MAVRSKTWVYARLLVGIAGLNPAGEWMFVYCEFCVVNYRSLRQADPSGREVLPSVCVSLNVNKCNSRHLHLE